MHDNSKQVQLIHRFVGEHVIWQDDAGTRGPGTVVEVTKWGTLRVLAWATELYHDLSPVEDGVETIKFTEDQYESLKPSLKREVSAWGESGKWCAFSNCVNRREYGEAFCVQHSVEFSEWPYADKAEQEDWV